MRSSTKFVLAAAFLSLTASTLRAQFPLPRPVAAVNASITGSAGCSECDWGKSRDISVGLMFRDAFTLEYRHAAWRALEGNPQTMSLDLAAIDLRAPAARVSPVVTLGVGRGSAAVNQSWGGHYEDKYAASNSFAASFGIGLDIRLRSRLTLTPLISAQGLSDVDVTHCMTSYNMYGVSSTTCSPGDPTRLSYTAFGLALGWR